MRAALDGNGFPVSIEASEFIHESPLLPEVEDLKAYGAISLTPGRPILEAALELTRRIKQDFEYHPGATDISTPLAQVFACKAGVCQDFAHVEIAALRAHGLAKAGEYTMHRERALFYEFLHQYDLRQKAPRLAV